MSPITSLSNYANAFTYMGLPLSRELNSADVFVLGIPYDLATTGRAGARGGPMAVRQASAHIRWEEKRWPWSFAAFERMRVADYGDLEPLTGNHESLLEEVEEHAGRLLKAGKKILSFGGDHFVALPLLRAHAKQHSKLAMIHFDAHTDTYSEAGCEYDHGSMFYHAPREGLIDPDKTVQIGIRTEYTVKDHPFKVIDGAEANDLSADEIVQQIKAVVGDTPTYLTFDIDCLDPAYAPGTGTPVPGGLTTDKALKIIRGLQGINLIGMDLVEVSPAYDQSEITALAGATLALEMLYVMASSVR
ncbi:agmatinase [Leucothrix arctica]|uniref:Agmatinase n=1 Tax=Leucothrix arctica TaxID=1481894 RepID=A0A317CD65_9GAMM|nr:agmatinase [Leucothrix arctica]PWQ96329.1 agmatinase [Leucothrix arctica]